MIGNSITQIAPMLICATDEQHQMYLYQDLKTGSYIITRAIGTAYRIVSIDEAQEFYDRKDTLVVADYDGELSENPGDNWKSLLTVWGE